MAERRASDVLILANGNFVIHLNQRLGHGAYGTVYKAERYGAPCVAKMLHDPLVQRDLVVPVGREHKTPFARFEQECELLRRLDHSNIVQYLDTCRDPRTGGLVLLLELMGDNLTNYLEQQDCSLPYCVQVNICQDVALALVYLHSNKIIHRDLSGKNILLSGIPHDIKAKVTDFGMVRLADRLSWSQQNASLTQCPGTDVYMPPEAVSKEPNYTEKIDCFSFGVIIVQILTRLFPDPKDRYVPVQLDGTQNTYICITEIDRRQNHITLIRRDHALLRIALDCLKDIPADRPTAQQLNERLTKVKSDDHHRMSTLQSTPPQESSTASKTEFKSISKHQSVQVGDDSACVLSGSLLPFEDDTGTVVKDKPPNSSIKLSWVKGPDAPCRLFQWCDAVAHGNLVYFRQGGAANLHNNYCYDTATRGWTSLPRCPLGQPTLVLIHDELTAIGDKDPISNQMYTLQTPCEDRWVVSQYPPMPTKRYFMIAVCTETSLIVAGGVGEGRKNFLSKVEVLDLARKQWSTAAALPMPLMRCSATLCGENLYVLSGRTLDLQLSPAVFTCSLRKLIESCQMPGDQSSGRQPVWTRIANVPVVDSTAVSVHHWLLAIGGAKVSDDKAISSAVHLYHPSSNSWEVISHMTVARFQCFATLLPNRQLMVVGGGVRPFPDFKCCRDVEFATPSLS